MWATAVDAWKLKFVNQPIYGEIPLFPLVAQSGDVLDMIDACNAIPKIQNASGDVGKSDLCKFVSGCVVL